MNTQKNYLMLVLGLFILNGCISRNGEKAITSEKKIYKLNLDKYKTENVDLYEEIFSHKNFDLLGSVDTFYIDKPLLFSVKRASCVSENGGDSIVFSSLDIIYKSDLILHLNKILTVGMYSFDKKRGILLVPVIEQQNIDDLTTEGKLYLCNIYSKKYELIDSCIINSSYGLFISDKNTVVYTNRDKLIRYFLTSRKRDTIADFDMPLISTFKMSIDNENLDVFYFQDFANDIADGEPMKRTTIPLNDLNLR